MTRKYPAYDATDPVEALADKLRSIVAAGAGAAHAEAVRQGMSPSQCGQMMFGGLITGAVGALLAICDETGHDALMDEIVRYLPQARANAEGIMKGSEH